MLRRLFAAVLALALGSVPLVADWCALSCEVAHAPALGGAPACHHTAAAAPRVGQVPAPCGHDHHPVVVDAGTIAAVACRGVVAAAVPGHAAVHQPWTVATALRSRVDSTPSSPPFDLTLASILRT